MITSNTALLEGLKQVIDPEIGVNIVDLGLVYDLVITPEQAELRMTLTSPACPMGEMLCAEVKAVMVQHLPPACAPVVTLVWNPPWTPERMSAEAKSGLGW